MAWNAYRGWAKRARDLQAGARRWNLAALVFIVFAAACGAATTLTPAAPSPWNVLGTWLASAAAVASAVGAYLGREILGSGKEAGWIQARATAEGIKSEGYRYVAKAGADAVGAPEATEADVPPGSKGMAGVAATLAGAQTFALRTRMCASP